MERKVCSYLQSSGRSRWRPNRGSVVVYALLQCEGRLPTTVHFPQTVWWRMQRVRLAASNEIFAAVKCDCHPLLSKARIWVGVLLPLSAIPLENNVITDLLTKSNPLIFPIRTEGIKGLDEISLGVIFHLLHFLCSAHHLPPLDTYPVPFPNSF